MNPPDLRKVSAEFDPTYEADETIATLEISPDFGGLTLTSVTGLPGHFIPLRPTTTGTRRQVRIPARHWRYSAAAFHSVDCRAMRTGLVPSAVTSWVAPIVRQDMTDLNSKPINGRRSCDCRPISTVPSTSSSVCSTSTPKMTRRTRLRRRSSTTPRRSLRRAAAPQKRRFTSTTLRWHRSSRPPFSASCIST